MTRIVCALIAGILLHDLLPAITIEAIIPVALGGLIGCWLCWRHDRQQQSKVTRCMYQCFLVLLFIAIGGLLHYNSQPRTDIAAGKHTVVLQLRNNPQPRTHSLRCEANIRYVAQQEQWITSDDHIMLYLTPDSINSHLKSGYTLLTTLDIRIPQDRLPNGFNYQAYLRHKGINYTAYLPNTGYTIIDTHATTLRHKANRLQQNLSLRFSKTLLTPDHQQIASAMLLGVRPTQNNTYQQIKQSGIIHILCVSGLHVGILASAIGFCLSAIGNSRRMRLLKAAIQLICIWGYVLLTGLASATVRASLMFSIFITCGLFRRHPRGIDCLSLSAFVMLICNPMQLFDISFQLSYAAMLGITLLYPVINNIVASQTNKNPYTIPKAIGKGLWSLLCLSLSAQLYTLPLTLYYFQQFPTYFLIGNILVVPFTGVIMITELATLLLTGCPTLFTIISYLLEFELSILDGITARISALPGSTLNFTVGTVQSILIGLGILIITQYLHHIKSNY